MAIGSNGLINKAEKARNLTIVAKEKEAISLAWGSLFIKKTTKEIMEINKLNFKEELDNTGNETQVEYVNNNANNDFLVTFVKTTHEYTVDRDGNITFNGATDIAEEVTPNHVVLSSIRAWTNSDNSDFHKSDIRNLITEIEFVDLNNKPAPSEFNENSCWDVSEENNQSIIAWLEDSKLYIGGANGVLANSNSSFMFYNFQNVESIKFNNIFDTSNVINMNSMFRNCISLEKLDLSSFNTSNVSNMSYIFSGSLVNDSQTIMSLNELDMSNFNTRNVENMEYMFFNCGNLTTIDVSSFDTHNVNSMKSMFNMPNDLSSHVEHIVFGENWNTENVTDMSYMFGENTSLKTIDLSNFNTRNVDNMYYLFGRCTNLRTIYATENFDVSNVTDYRYMFHSCNLLMGGNGCICSGSIDANTNWLNYTCIDSNEQQGYFSYLGTNSSENNTRLEYINATGEQYIDTFYPLWKNNNWKIEVKFDISEFYNYNNMFGFSTVKDTNNEMWIASDKNYYVRVGGIDKTSIATLELDTPYTIVHDNTGDNFLNYVNGELVKTLNKANTNKANNISFAHRKDSSYLKGKIYGLKLWSDGKLVRNFEPSYNTVTNAAGLYDTVEGIFYACVGTNSFTAGPNKNN